MSIIATITTPEWSDIHGRIVSVRADLHESDYQWHYQLHVKLPNRPTVIEVMPFTTDEMHAAQFAGLISQVGARYEKLT
jgi:hypothetical protein